MDRSRSGGETERRGRHVERWIERKDIKERDSQHQAASSPPRYRFSRLCARGCLFNVGARKPHTRACACNVTVIDGSQPEACSKAGDFIINRTWFNLLLQAEQRCSLCCLFMNGGHTHASMTHAAKNSQPRRIIRYFYRKLLFFYVLNLHAAHFSCVQKLYNICFSKED